MIGETDMPHYGLATRPMEAVSSYSRPRRCGRTVRGSAMSPVPTL